MRTQQVNTVTVTYPNSTVFTADNIFISISDDVYPVGAQISVTNTSTLRTKTLTYVSELKNLTFDIADTVRMLSDETGSTLNVKVAVYTDQFYVGSFAFNIQTLCGRSLTSRSHGSAKTFYVYSYDELYKFHLMLAGTGALRVDGGGNIPVTQSGRNSFNLQSYINATGEHSLCYYMGVKGGGDHKDYVSGVEITNVEPSVFDAVVSLEYHDLDPIPTDPIKGGGIWEDSRIDLSRYCMRLIYDEPCNDFNFFEIKYWDTDGCERYLGGKIDSTTTESKQKNYVGTRNSVYRDISQRHIEEANETVKVLFADIRRDAYFEDVLLSPHVYFRNYAGEWMPCSIADSKITIKSDDYSDLTLNIETWKQ